MDFLQRLEQSNMRLTGSDTPPESDSGAGSPFFAVDRVKTPACLDLRLREGLRVAVPYSYFTGMSYDIELGIEILTTQKRIIITGRNLGKLYEALISYRVRYIQMHVGNDGDEDGLFVKAILVEGL